MAVGFMEAVRGLIIQSMKPKVSCIAGLWDMPNKVRHGG